jgi:hypothetical protein
MSTKSLWGQLPPTEGIRTPTQVLKEQATVLTDMTRGVLQGEVSVSHGGGVFSLDLHIVVPALDNYRYVVARATHGIDLYPVTVTPGWKYNPKGGIVCADEGEFERELGTILSSEKVQHVVASLLAQSRAM